MPSITAPYHNHAQNFPEKMAIQTQEESLTYQTWYERVHQTANWIDSFHLRHGTLGILLPNGLQLLQFFTGAAAAGWTAVLFDIRWTQEELLERLNLSCPDIFITTRELSGIVQPLHSKVLIVDDCLPEIHQCSHERVLNEMEGSLPFYMGFTSGTTGKPKAFIRSHQSWVASFDCTRTDFHINENDQVMIPGPLIHSHFLYGVISTLFVGGSVYLLEKFTPRRVLSTIEVWPITVVYVVPTMIAGMLGEGVSVEKPIKLISSGAKWETNSKEQFRKMFPAFSMYEFYGASELSFVSVLMDKENDTKPGSVGKPCHNVSIQIRRSNSELTVTNEPGKIFVKSDMLFLGYIDSSASSTQQIIKSIHDKDGWITVDDMGYLDEDGYLYITGREKNMILYGGINIFPEEIERVIETHPNVKEVAVVGMDDPYWGQIPVAVIKGNTSKLELQRWCKGKLSSVKLPRKWFFIEEMPHTTSGKIARLLVKEYILNVAGERL